MSIRRLKTLVAFADHGSFVGAAKAVHVSQAAVSMQFKSLEDDLQTTLFDRSKRPPTLNRMGHALVAGAREIIDAYEELVRLVSDKDALSGELIIGATPTTMAALVPRAVRALRDLYPKMHIRIVPGQSPNLMVRLDQDRLDASIVHQPPHLPSHMEFKPFVREPMVILVPMDCPLNDPEEILESSPFIRFNRKFWAGQMIDEWLRMRKIHVNELMELDTLDMISTMVYHGLGVSIVPQQCVPPPVKFDLKQIPLGPSSTPRVLGLLLKKHHPKAFLSDVFFNQLVQVIEAEKSGDS